MDIFENEMKQRYSNVSFSNIQLNSGSIIVTFDLTTRQSLMETILVSLLNDLKEGLVLHFEGHNLKAGETMEVEGEVYYGPNGPTYLEANKSNFPVSVVIVVSLLIVVIIVGKIRRFYIPLHLMYHYEYRQAHTAILMIVLVL